MKLELGVEFETDREVGPIQECNFLRQETEELKRTTEHKYIVSTITI